MIEPSWQKSSFSSSDGTTNCIELAVTPAALLLRESDEPATVLITSPHRLAALLRLAKERRR